MTGHISRRSLYYSHDASSSVSVVKFDSEAGNVPFVRRNTRSERTASDPLRPLRRASRT